MWTNTAECRGAVALSPRLLSLRETMVLAGTMAREKEIRNDIFRGVLPAANVIRLENSHLCFHWPHVLTFAAVYGNSIVDSAERRRVALWKVFIVASGGHSECEFAVLPTACVSAVHDAWRRVYDCDFGPVRVEIDDFFEINLGKACKEVRPRINLYVEGLERVEEKDAVLGGSAVFRDTRISVLHIGKMAERGVSMKEILEDYPKLTEGDVEFAKLYYLARPPVGRPPGAGGVKHAELDE
jgi:uncharacterized protein (DUF433 family)